MDSVHSKFFSHQITLCPLQNCKLSCHVSPLQTKSQTAGCIMFVCDLLSIHSDKLRINDSFKKKAMQVTDSINIRWNQYNKKRKGLLLRIIFPILPVLCLLGEVHRNERKNNHAIYVENISKVAKALRRTSEITKLYECPICTQSTRYPGNMLLFLELCCDQTV